MVEKESGKTKAQRRKEKKARKNSSQQQLRSNGPFAYLFGNGAKPKEKNPPTFLQQVVEAHSITVQNTATVFIDETSFQREIRKKLNNQ